MGGLVAFEMAQQLRASGRNISLLALFDTGANNSTAVADSRDDAALLVALLDKLDLSVDFLRTLQPDEQLRYVYEKAKDSSVVPDDMGLEECSALLRLYKTNTLAMLRYHPQPYQGRIVLFRTPKHPSKDPTLGWAQFAAEGVEVCEIPGTHRTLMSEPHVQVLAERLRCFIDERRPSVRSLRQPTT